MEDVQIVKYAKARLASFSNFTLRNQALTESWEGYTSQYLDIRVDQNLNWFE